jgi:glycerol-3-phosphate dehydrogenase subunit C
MINLENKSFDHCIKCTICTIYCPVARVTHLFPGPKQSGPDAERLRKKNPFLADVSLSYCNNCKRCEIACPSDVEIADIIQTAKWRFIKKRFRMRDFFLSRTDLVGGAAVMVNRLVNLFTGLRFVKFLMEFFLAIPSKRLIPGYERGTFSAWFRRKCPDQSAFSDRVVYFHGCFVNYNDHGLGRDLVRVLNAMNIGVEIAGEKCCGVPLIANGYLEKARTNGLHNLGALVKASAGRDLRIVSTSSSCAYALKYEYPGILELDNTAIAGNLQYITEFLCSHFDRGNIPGMRPVGIRAAYHAPCHLERMGGSMYTIEMMKRIPGLDLILLHSECCGIAGTYGFKNENYRISQDMGRDLFRRIEAADPEYVITDCETCRLQIEMNTNYQVLHPVNLLAMAIGDEFYNKSL